MGPDETHEVLGSTQERAADLARRGAPDFTVVSARRQTAGIGRLDHAWESPTGGLYCSVIAPSPPTPPTLFPLAVGEELSRRLAARWAVRARIKWPNDLWVAEPGSLPGKLAGILVDRVETPIGPRLVAGIGVNVRSRRADFPVGLRGAVVTLAELLPEPPTIEAVCDEAVASVRAATRSLATPDGCARVVAGCRRSLFGVGRPALVDGRPLGLIRSVAEDGALTLADGPAEVRVYAGHLTVLEAS